MSPPAEILLSGFADETSSSKAVEEQFAAFAAMGLQFYSVRFVDLGSGVKNVMQLSDDELQRLKQLHRDFGLRVSSIGSPIGKTKLLDVDDGTGNSFKPFARYLAEDVQHACELAGELETKLIRGFSFYHPKGTQAEDHFGQAIDQLGQIAELCDRHGLTFGLEVEANLVGHTGHQLAEMHRQIGSAALVLIFDGANIRVQGFDRAEVFQQYLAMKPGLGWVHVKDYRQLANDDNVGYVDEAALCDFVPVEQGDCGYAEVFADLRTYLPELRSRLQARGLPGVFCDLEPHVKGGGQFGGFSGPDGFGVALRSLCRVLDQVGLGYQLRDFEDITAPTATNA